MSLSCDYGDGGDFDWYWESNFQYYPLNTKRSRKCCSCKAKISVCEESMIVHRHHSPSNDIEERIYGDEVPMTKWYLCETCGDLALSLNELGFCFTLGDDSLKQQIAEYRAEEKAWKARYGAEYRAEEKAWKARYGKVAL